MGLYINPPNATDAFEKAKMVAKKGMEVSRTALRDHPPGQDGLWGVIVVFNPAFVAAGIAWSRQEAQIMTSVDDWRIRNYYLLTMKDIEELDPHIADILKTKIAKGSATTVGI